MKKIILSFLFLSTYSFAQGIYPISSFDLTSSDSELLPLDKMIQAATLVGIGESGHGVKKYLNARTRLIKYLIENHNFRTILLESGYLSTENLNDYLLNCQKGNESDVELINALKLLDPTYQNVEMKNMLSWLCRYNQSAANKVSFHGIDQWEDPWDNRDLIKAAIPYASTNLFKTYYDQAEKNCFVWQINNWKDGPALASWQYLLKTWRLPFEEHRLCLGSLYSMQSEVNKLQVTEEQKMWTRFALKVAYTYEEYRDLYIVDITKALNMRDELQAYLTMSWKEKENTKSILLAHNIHVSKNQSKVIPKNPADQFKWVGVRSTGENLVGHYGKKYKSIALTGFDITSSRDGHYPLLNEEDSLDFYLAKRGDYLLVDPSSNDLKVNEKWWMHNESEPMYLNPSEQYDAIIFVKESEEATSLLP